MSRFSPSRIQRYERRLFRALSKLLARTQPTWIRIRRSPNDGYCDCGRRSAIHPGFSECWNSETKSAHGNDGYAVLTGLFLAAFLFGAPVAAAVQFPTRSGTVLRDAPAAQEKTMSVEDEVRLATKFERGDGVPRDPAQAAYWFQRAADHGHPEAQNELGCLYFWGHGVERNPEQSARWFTRAVGGGSQKAKLNLAVLYLGGFGVPQDPKFAHDLLLQLAEKGMPRAELYLGVLYSNGLGVAPDRSLGERWFRKAAKHKSPEAQYAMGMFYSRTAGHAHDLKEAADYLRRSARAGYPPAMQALGVLLIEHPELESKGGGGGLAYLMRAAESGFWRASAALGILERDGHDGAPNPGKAFRWFTIALRQGGQAAERLLTGDLSRCRSLLSAEDEARSTMAADRWLLSHPATEPQPVLDASTLLPFKEPELPR